ncbi:Predicted methyltransferase, contains TPR repeat [Marinobacterium lutimaris]|uniref:Predicted methyltransferase, contains TPR repeat n=2 Tax=Marinobacterium lutimaris TaxID=568106 RepID=A0A1H5YHI7_9GAMM|nr:Predicted methyltransferase, contains TPR repeat [Marinobacterium lutimaris]
MLMQQQAYPSAEAICQQLLARNPKDFNARHLLGVIKMHAGNPLSACKELKRAAELPVAERFRAQALNNLSLALKQRSRFDEALRVQEQALTLVPDEESFQINRLYLLEVLESWPAIIHTLQQHPSLNPIDELQCLFARAERHSGATEKALARMDCALSEDDSNLETLGEYCLLLSLSGTPLAPEKLASLTIEQLESVADYLAEEGYLNTALPLYSRLLELDPKHAAARHMVDAATGELAEHAPEQYVRDLYDTHAEQFEQQLVDRLGYRAPAMLSDALTQLLPHHLSRVADLGCGSGLLGRSLRKAFHIEELSGCDLSAGMLDEARKQGGYDLLEQANLLDWLRQQKQEQQPLQLICATDVLIYIGDLGAVMKAVHQALTADGTFAFTVEAAEEDLELATTGRYRHSEAHLRQRAAEAGLEVISCTRFPLREEQGRMQTGLMVLSRKPASI